MKSKIIIFGILLFFAILNGRTWADLLGFSYLEFDSSIESGITVFPSQGLSFKTAEGILSLSVQGVDLSYDGVSTSRIVNGTLKYRVKLLKSSLLSNSTINGVFVSPGSSSADLTITDGAKTLLMGNFSSFTITGLIGSGLGSASGVLVITGGTLAPSFTATGDPRALLTLNIDRGSLVFSSNSFASDFNGSVSGKISNFTPVPAPSSYSPPAIEKIKKYLNKNLEN